MSRRRFQAPKPYKEGNFWRIRVYEDAINDEGKVYRARPSYVLGPCIGPRKLNEKEARQEANERVLNTLNTYAACPQSVMTLEQFVAVHFDPNVVQKMKHAGKCHYTYCLTKIVPVLGKLRLRDIQPGHVRKLTNLMESTGYSPKTISHIKTAITTIFNAAKEERMFTGDNPAAAVRLQEVSSPEKYAYSFEEAQKVIALLISPVQDMVFMSMTTSMNIAELCGLRWKRVNLTDKTIYSAGEAIPPFSVLVREDYYRNRWGTVKTKKRRRTVGLADYLVERLKKLRQVSKFTGVADPVFAGRNGNPVDAHNTNNRVFKKVSAAIGVPVTWHIFRHSASTFTEALDMTLSDRVALMGHATAEMTQHYTHSDVARRRLKQNELAEKLIPAEEKRQKEFMQMPIEGPKQ